MSENPTEEVEESIESELTIIFEQEATVTPLREGPEIQETSETETETQTMANQVTIGGISIPTVQNPAESITGSLVTLKKEERSQLTPDKRTKLFEKFTKAGQQSKFKLLSLSLASVEDLQETYDLQLNLTTLENTLLKYDMLDVFNIVYPIIDQEGKQTGGLNTEFKGATQVTKTRNLFKYYNEISEEQVAQSTMWYARWPDPTAAPWFRENLSLSFDYLQNHMDNDLWGKVMEDYEPYNGTPAHGGPLVFWYLLQRLQVNSQLVIESLHAKLKTLRIDQYEGEDVSKLVGHARAIFRRLRSLTKRDVNGVIINQPFPTDISHRLIKLFQTSSDPRLNEIFHAEEVNAYKHSLTMGDKAYGNPETILDLALKVYSNLLSSVEGWTGQYHKANETGFTAQTEIKCWNCGGDHTLKQCPKPLNEARIKQAKKAFWDSREKGTGRGGRGRGRGRGKGRGGRGRGRGKSKWPAPPKQRQFNRLKINDKWHYYHFNQKKWLECDDQTDAANEKFVAKAEEAQVAQPQTTSQPPSTIETNTKTALSEQLSQTFTEFLKDKDQNQMKQATSDFVSSINGAVNKFASHIN